MNVTGRIVPASLFAAYKYYPSAALPLCPGYNRSLGRVSLVADVIKPLNLSNWVRDVIIITVAHRAFRIITYFSDTWMI